MNNTEEQEKDNIGENAEAPAGTSNSEDVLQQKIEAATKEAEAARDQLLRIAAEFANYKRRMESEFRSVIENASERLITDLLPVLDDLDRFLQSSRKHENSYEALVQGVELISNKINGILSRRGLKAFESAGQAFDVNLHDALLQIARDDIPPNMVVEEVGKGYRLNEKVLRHAKVIVSAAADSVEPTLPDPDKEDSEGNRE